jgi:tetratricopeptide (TPR) repeat protein
MDWWRRALALALVLECALASVAVAAPSPADRRELQARKEFAAGDYQGALDLFAELFAESADPVFLRNIGRCYQQMDRPAEAIKSFRYYLQRAPNLEAGERAEVEGFIADLQRKLDAQEALAAPATTAAAPAPAIVPPPVLLSPRPAAAAPRLAPATINRVREVHPQALRAPAAPPAPPLYTRWWLWTGVAVLAGAVVTAVALSGRGEVGSCQGLDPCYRVGGR